MSDLLELKQVLAEANIMVANLKAKIANLEKPKIEKWEPKGGNWYIDCKGDVYAGVSTEGTCVFGVERETKELADAAAVEMRIFNRLLAYRDEFAPGYNPDWPNHNEDKFYIYKCGESWDWSKNATDGFAGGVYMPKDVAKELVRKLNSGEVVL